MSQKKLTRASLPQFSYFVKCRLYNFDSLIRFSTHPIKTNKAVQS